MVISSGTKNEKPETSGNKTQCQTTIKAYTIKADTQFNGFDSKHSHRYCNHIMVRFVIDESDFPSEVLRSMDDYGC